MNALLTFVIITSQMENVKLGPVKLDEFVLPVAILWAAGLLVRNNWRVKLLRDARPLAANYLLFGLLAGFLALYNFFVQNFSVPSDASALNEPGIITLARLVQIGLAVAVMLIIYQACVRDPKSLNRLIRVYIYAGVTVAVYAIICFAMGVNQETSLIGPVAGSYKTFDLVRARGLFNEGGPYGLYLFTVIVTLLVSRFYLRIFGRTAFWGCLAVVALAFTLSSSKAGIAALLGLLLLGLFVTRIRLRYKLLAFGLLAFLGGVAFASGLYGSAIGYFTASEAIQEEGVQAASRSGIGGRVGALLIVPNMVIKNPFSGVGLGNYSITRNDRAYLGVLLPVNSYDLPGIGLIGDVAELGVPLWVFFCVLLLAPVIRAFRAKAPPLLVMASTAQFMCHLFGAQDSLIYPWITSGLILACIPRRDHSPTSSRNAVRPTNDPRSLPTGVASLTRLTQI